jgi:hypothetical protein
MRQRIFVACLFWCILLFSGCASEKATLESKREVSGYSTQMKMLDQPFTLELSNQSGNIQIYVWNKKEICFEITKKIVGVEEEETLKKKLENFKVKLSQERGNVVFTTNYQGSLKGIVDKSCDLVVYIPKKIDGIHCKLDSGSIKIRDKIKCNLNLEMNRVNVETDLFQGKINVLGNCGNVCIQNGELTNGSSVKLNRGNIEMKGGFDDFGEYSLETDVGNIDLKLSAPSEICFQCIGDMIENVFPDGNFPTKVHVKSGMGKISIQR